MDNEQAYVVNVHSLAIYGNCDFIAFAFFRIGETEDIPDAGFASRSVKGPRQLRQDRWGLQIHDERNTRNLK